MPEPILTVDRENIPWEIIIETILDQNCILFLGPLIFRTAEHEGLYDRFANHLDFHTNTDIRNYYRSDALFQFSSPMGKTRSLISIKRFLKETAFDNARLLYQKLSEIPFHIIFTATPDTLLEEVFEEQNINYKFDYYHKNHPPKGVDVPLIPIPESPLIYKIFGHIKVKNSLILTHDDLFDYLNSILSEESMHPDLKQTIKKAENFIFLGVPFNKWYMRLLLKLLYRLHGQEEFLRYSNEEVLNEEVYTLVTDQFRIEFINRDLWSFVDELHRRLGKTGGLRTNNTDNIPILNQLRSLVAKAKITEGIDGLMTFIDKVIRADGSLSTTSQGRMKEMKDNLLTLHAKSRRLKERIHKGTISDSDRNIRSNEITESLISYIQLVEKLL